MIILITESSLFLFHLWSLQTQHALQDPGAGEASDGAERLHDQPCPAWQPARPAQPRTHGVAQPEATHTQVDGEKKSRHTVSSALFFTCPEKQILHLLIPLIDSSLKALLWNSNIKIRGFSIGAAAKRVYTEPIKPIPSR